LANVTISSGTSNLATTAITNGTSNVTIASSGGNIAMATNGNTAVTIDTSQNVTIAQAIKLSYSANSNYSTDGALSNYSSTNGVYLNGNTAGWLRLAGDGTQASYIQITGATYSTSNQIQFITGGSQRATIDASGNLLVGTTTSRGKITVQFNTNSSATPTVYFGNDGGTGVFASFGDAGGTVIGTIARSGSSTNYNTSSDYRLKENIIPMTGALAKVALLKPCTYKWNVDGSDGQGFIAHELAEVVPDCVTGEKDAIETYTDEDGNEATRPVYQGIDTSFLVATLTAALQETKALIDTQAETINALTARIVALEAK